MIVVFNQTSCFVIVVFNQTSCFVIVEGNQTSCFVTVVFNQTSCFVIVVFNQTSWAFLTCECKISRSQSRTSRSAQNEPKTNQMVSEIGDNLIVLKILFIFSLICENGSTQSH